MGNSEGSEIRLKAFVFVYSVLRCSNVFGGGEGTVLGCAFKKGEKKNFEDPWYCLKHRDQSKKSLGK